jgi:hypothetical protein
VTTALLIAVDYYSVLMAGWLAGGPDVPTNQEYLPNMSGTI